MKILTAKQMARWDRLSIGKNPQVAKRLMGKAAAACVEVLLEKSGGTQKLRELSETCGPVVMVCGPGNNGGDGFAMASLLKDLDIACKIFFLGKTKHLSPESKFFYENLKQKPSFISKNTSLAEFKQTLRSATWVVDAIFGTGLSRKILGHYAKVIPLINQSKARKLAVDTPSGLCGNTGEVLGVCFIADITVSLGAPKWGQVIQDAWDVVGELIVKPIGLKQKILKTFNSPAQWLSEATLRPWFQPRPKNWHKGRAGRVLVVAGSKEMPGAGCLSALGALRSGAGLVHWVLPSEVKQKFSFDLPEVILNFLPSYPTKKTGLPNGVFSPAILQDLKKMLPNFKSLALGPGWGNQKETQEFLADLLKNALTKRGGRLPYVLDADGLNALSKQRKLYPLIKGAILTPHPKEMERLLGRALPVDLNAKIKVLKSFAKRYQVYLILKSYRSIIVNPQGEVWLNSVGAPNLAVAGSGDVLTGVITGLLAQGFSKKQALLAGAYLHGRAGDLLAQDKGDRGTLASEVALTVPKVIASLIKKR